LDLKDSTIKSLKQKIQMLEGEAQRDMQNNSIASQAPDLEKTQKQLEKLKRAQKKDKDSLRSALFVLKRVVGELARVSKNRGPEQL